MFIDLNNSSSKMKLVYTLTNELNVEPEQLELTHKLTLDKSRPKMGLKGRYGLFATEEWWQNIQRGKIKLYRCAGVIVDVYVAGQDYTEINTIDLQDENGVIHMEGIFVNDPADLVHFKIGHRAEIVRALDELKNQPAEDGGKNYSKITLEMAVSVD
jgi:hypothetical protein